MLPTANDRNVVVQSQITALGTAATVYVPAPVSGKIKYIAGALDAVVDANVAITSDIAGTAITGGGFSFLVSGTAVGQVKGTVPTAANSVVRGQAIGITTDGGGNAGSARFVILIEQD